MMKPQEHVRLDGARSLSIVELPASFHGAAVNSAFERCSIVWFTCMKHDRLTPRVRHQGVQQHDLFDMQLRSAQQREDYMGFPI